MAGGTVGDGGRRRLSVRSRALLIHPAVLASLAVLVVNDHLLKRLWPGPVTGIASDVAGLVLLPVVVTVGLDAVRPAPLRTRGVFAAGAAVAAGFAAVELLPAADAAYEVGLGIAGWPIRSAFGGGGLRVEATPDPWDLLALPLAFTAAWLWSRTDQRSRTAAPTGPGRRRLAPLAVVLLAPALLATSPEPDTIEASTTSSDAIVLDTAHPAGTLRVVVDADLPRSTEERSVKVVVELPHHLGEPALLASATGTREDAATAYVEGTSDGSGIGMRLDWCTGPCRREVLVTVELADPASGTWTGQPTVSVEVDGGTDGEVSVSAALDAGRGSDPTGRMLASAPIRALEGGEGAGPPALLLRTRHPSAATSAWDGNGDFQSDQIDVVAALPDHGNAHLHVTHGQFGFDDHLPAEIDGRWCEQAVSSCEQLAVVFPPREPFDPVPGRGSADPIVVAVVDGRPEGADPVEVDLVPATLDTVTVNADDPRYQSGIPVAVPPGQTLYALIDAASRHAMWEDELVIEATASDGRVVRTDFRPGVTEIEACPPAAAAPCTATIRWSMKVPGAIELQTLLAPSA